MKTFNKTYLPEFIVYNKKKYDKIIQKTDLHLYKSIICIKVLSRNLKNKTDLFNQQYKPTVWYFTIK